MKWLFDDSDIARGGGNGSKRKDAWTPLCSAPEAFSSYLNQDPRTIELGHLTIHTMGLHFSCKLKQVGKIPRKDACFMVVWYLPSPPRPIVVYRQTDQSSKLFWNAQKTALHFKGILRGSWDTAKGPISWLGRTQPMGQSQGAKP